ncbi:MAG: Glu/Leu/Phe/Val dehydrogenase [bacterium]|nr:Glu/Leu/Phe/Val dehydrogenase [bacterium]
MAHDVLQNVWNRYIKALEILKFEDRLIKELTSFKARALSFDIDATIGGKPERLTAIDVWHRGPLTDAIFKGGHRFLEGLTLDSLQSHAAEMSPKCWIHLLPFGGAKGGIDVDPRKCTPEELEAITYKFVDELNERDAIGPFRRVPAPDVGTNPLIMFWMAERYKYWHRGDPYTKGVVTGKPVKLQNGYVGGIHGRTEATGYGLITALDEFSQQKYNLFSLPEHPIVTMEGFGNVGSHAALIGAQRGYKFIAICDKFGGVFNGNGLDIPELVRYVRSHKLATVDGFPEADPITFDEILELPSDIFMPNALEETLTEKNADRVGARIIAEGANGPTTPEADKILEDKGIFVLPDIYANSMGVVVSFFEWGMNTNQTDPRIPQRNEKALVLKAGEKMMRKAGAQIIQRMKQHDVNARLAAYILALEKAELLRARRMPEYAASVLS